MLESQRITKLLLPEGLTVSFQDSWYLWLVITLIAVIAIYYFWGRKSSGDDQNKP